METLAQQFDEALSFISLGDKAKRAQDAHKEIREHLESSEELRDLGVDTILIGSYGRATAIYPGNDVDVFTKLTEADKDHDPTKIFKAVADALIDKYGSAADPQDRSVTIAFGEDFTVDVVPAVRSGERWAIPNRNPKEWGNPEGRWVETDPEKLGELAVERNKDPKVGDQGAYVPISKLLRQTRRHHLGDDDPSGFYIELVNYWAFKNGISGDSFAELFAAALRLVADQLQGEDELIDPALDEPFKPTPEPDDLERAGELFNELAIKADNALGLPRCPAAVVWREILGKNERGHCFPLPEGCDEDGKEIPKRSAVTARGSREAGGFA